MRSASRLAAAVLLISAFTACDSSQPAQVEVSMASVNISAANAFSRQLDVWNMIEDNDNDGFPDNGETYFWCEGPSSQSAIPITVPWNYSAEISVIRAGTNVTEVITSEAASDDQFNVADYDRSSEIIGNTLNKPNVIVDGRIFKFSFPRRWPAVREELMNDTGNPLAELTGGDFGTGLCTAGTPGPARLDDQELPYTLELNKGDTIIVKARMSDRTQSGSGLTTILEQPPTAIGGRLQIDGRTVNVQGSTSGTSLSFSFTVQ